MKNISSRTSQSIQIYINGSVSCPANTEERKKKDVAVEENIYIFSASIVLHIKINKGFTSIA